MNQTNPFAALSLIAAPAVLTNACSVMALGTSNRLARAVDRARQLTTELEQQTDPRLPLRLLHPMNWQQHSDAR